MEPTTPSRSALFIGGLADGQRHPDPDRPYWVMARHSYRPIHPHHYPEPVSYKTEEAVYRRECLRSGSEEWVIYVLDSLTTTQAMRMMVSGYSPRERRPNQH
jgi:hypothetical protein